VEAAFMSICFRLVCIVPLLTVLVPSVAAAQDTTFGDLSRRLRAGQEAIVVDRMGARIGGRVLEISPDAVVLQVDGLSAPQTFPIDEVATIKRPGPIWDGAVKGAGIAVAITAIVLGRYGNDYPDVFLTTALMGAGIGVGIDALWGPKVVYRAPNTRSRMIVGPIGGAGRKGVAATIRF
jgi:hypothetical protein